MKVAALQLNSQGLSSTKLYNYIRIAHKKEVKVLVLGEYVLNPFFKELEKLSLEMIDSSSKLQAKVLKELATTYNMTIVAPQIILKGKKPYKVITKFAPKSVAHYYQQILINYPHWNEEKFFANEIAPLKAPLTFKVENVKFAIMAGFEMHFDALWHFVDQKSIDCVVIPSVSTFESASRWSTLASMRAFTHNCYILRVNRIGEYHDKKAVWHFYGDSTFSSPHGEILEYLGDEEELLIGEVSHQEVVEAKKIWHFREQLLKRDLL